MIVELKAYKQIVERFERARIAAVQLLADVFLLFDNGLHW